MKHRSRLWHAVEKVIHQEIKKSILLLAAVAGSIGFALIPPLVLEQIVNCLTGAHSVPVSLGFLYFSMLVVSGFFDAAKEVMITIFGQKITHGLRSEMCAKLSRLPTEYFSRAEAGKTTSRLVNDVDTVGTLFDNGIISMFADACKVISILIIIFIKSLGLGCMMLVLIPLLFILTRYFQKWMRRAQLANRRAISKVNNHVPETLANIRMIHTFYKQKYMEDRYDSYIQESYRAVEKTNLYDSVYSPIILITSSGVISVMMILAAMGGNMQNFFGMTVGTSVAVIAYVGKVFAPLESIGMEIQNIQSAVAGVSRIDEFLAEPERDVVGEGGIFEPEQARKQSGRPDVEFSQVTFGYEKEKPILQEFTCQIQAGEHVTLIGRTGAGKSTMLRLLLGLYEPNAGQVQIFGKEAGKIPDQEKRKIFGYVEQSFSMVDGTIAEQISLFDTSIETEQIVQAAKLVGLHEIITALPNGYDTPAEYKYFSQGQLQLLAIARAVVSEPAILLLDEITANLDSVTEQRVMAALDCASRERTVVSISHRIYEQSEQVRKMEIGLTK